METFISSVETSVQPPNTLERSEKSVRNAPYYEPFVQFARQKEISSLKKLIREKDSRIEQLAKENQFLYEELERLRVQGEEELKKSDALIEQMQAASEESSKRALAIIMHLSKQVEKQAEHIEFLQDSQGLGGTVRQLRSKLPFLRVGSTKQQEI
jgi:predicted RNase H-like nuclease (RuvC/YqgF family)